MNENFEPIHSEISETNGGALFGVSDQQLLFSYVFVKKIRDVKINQVLVQSIITSTKILFQCYRIVGLHNNCIHTQLLVLNGILHKIHNFNTTESSHLQILNSFGISQIFPSSYLLRRSLLPSLKEDKKRLFSDFDTNNDGLSVEELIFLSRKLDMLPLRIFFQDNMTLILSALLQGSFFCDPMIPNEYLNLPSVQNGNSIHILFCNFHLRRQKSKFGKLNCLHISHFIPHASKITSYLELRQACRNLVGLFRCLFNDGFIISYVFGHWIATIDNVDISSTCVLSKINEMDIEMAVLLVSETLFELSTVIHDPQMRIYTDVVIVNKLRNSLAFDPVRIAILNMHHKCTTKSKLIHIR